MNVDRLTTKRTSYQVATANFLGFKGLRCATRGTTKATREFEVVWSELVNTIITNDENRKCAAISNCQFALDTLKKALLNADNVSEAAFDQGMFVALQQCLVKSGLAEAMNVIVKPAKEADPMKVNTNMEGPIQSKTKKTKLILLKSNTESNLVVGIICQVNMARGLRERKNEDSSIANELSEGNQSIEDKKSPLTGKSKVIAALPDHCVCVLNKVKATCSVIDCFSVVEFKRNDSSSQDFLGYVDLQKEHGSLAQAMSYTIQYVLKYHARRGHLPDYLPWTVIARRKKTNAKSNTTRAGKSKSQQQG